MSFRPRALQLAPWLLMTCLTGSTAAQTPLAESVVFGPQPADSGFVLIGGEYLPPPYRVQGNGPREVVVNGRRLTLTQWELDGEDVWRAVGGGEQMTAAERVRATLRLNGLVWILDSQRAACVMAPRSHAVLETVLESAGDPHQAGRELARFGFPWSDADALGKHTGELRNCSLLKQRLEPVLAAHRDRRERDRLAHELYVSTANVLRTDAARYGVTVLAMALTVLGFGQLLNDPPKRRARWRDVDTRGDRIAMVSRNVVLIAALSLFDLGCTIAAQQAGGFLELNPLNQSVLSGQPLSMLLFKLSGVGLASGILLSLRRYRGAQKASWWLCLVVVLLAFRWITYNSMFMV